MVFEFTFMAASTVTVNENINIHRIISSAGSTACVQGEPPIDLVDRIKSYIADPDHYEAGESRPESATLGSVIQLIEDTRKLQVGLRNPKISTFYGEIDLTWENRFRMVRVIAYPGAKITQLYVLVKDDSSVPKGTMKDAIAKDLADELALVYSHTMASV